MISYLIIFFLSLKFINENHFVHKISWIIYWIELECNINFVHESFLKYIYFFFKYLNSINEKVSKLWLALNIIIRKWDHLKVVSYIWVINFISFKRVNVKVTTISDHKGKP